MKDQIILIYSYLHGIWGYRWSALVISGVIAISGWMVVYTLPNQYTSQVVMHVDTKSVMQPLLEGLAVESDVDAGLSIMSRILLSRKNLEEVIRQTDLALEAGSPEAMDGLLSSLGRSITLKSGSKRRQDNGIYELSYYGKSPEVVYQVVSKLLNTLIESTLASARTDTAAAQQFLDTQIEKYEARLTLAEQKLAKFKRANVGFMPDEKGGYYNRLQREQGELDAIHSDLRLAKRRLFEMRKQLEGELPLLDAGNYGAPQAQKLRQYRERLEDLLSQYTEQHPDVLALRANIAELIEKGNAGVAVEDTVSRGTGDSVEYNPVYQELKAEIHKASVDVETLKIKLLVKGKSVETLRQSVDIIPDVEAKLAKLNRDYEITRERYLSMVERRESARLAQAVGLSGSNINFRIIESPRIPTGPSGPNRLLFLTAVFAAAIAAGLGWGFLRYLLEPTFIDSSQVRNKIGIPVLGSVGLYMTPEHKKQRRLQLGSFLVVFFLLTAMYGGVMVFSGPGSELVSALMSSRSL